MAEGIVPVGGVALLHAKAVVAKLKGDNPDQDAGITIILLPLGALLRCIVHNVGDEPSVVVNTVMTGNALT